MENTIKKEGIIKSADYIFSVIIIFRIFYKMYAYFDMPLLIQLLLPLLSCITIYRQEKEKETYKYESIILLSTKILLLLFLKLN